MQTLESPPRLGGGEGMMGMLGLGQVLASDCMRYEASESTLVSYTSPADIVETVLFSLSWNLGFCSTQKVYMFLWFRLSLEE
jgi:hypothetical protein